MIRDLVEYSVRLVKEEKINEVKNRAKGVVESKLVEAIYVAKKDSQQDLEVDKFKAQILSDLQEGKLDNDVIEIVISEQNLLELCLEWVQIWILAMFWVVFSLHKEKRKN